MKTAKEHLDEAYARYLLMLSEYAAVLKRNDRYRKYTCGICGLIALLITALALSRFVWAHAVGSLIALVCLPLFAVDVWLRRKASAVRRRAEVAERDYEAAKRAHVVSLTIDGLLERDVQ